MHNELAQKSVNTAHFRKMIRYSPVFGLLYARNNMEASAVYRKEVGQYFAHREASIRAGTDL